MIFHLLNVSFVHGFGNHIYYIYEQDLLVKCEPGRPYSRRRVAVRMAKAVQFTETYTAGVEMAHDRD